MSRSFSGVLIGEAVRCAVQGQKVEAKFQTIARGGLLYDSDTVTPDYDTLSVQYQQYTRKQIEELFTVFCQIDESGDYRLSG